MYLKLFGEADDDRTRARTNVQQILYVEDACRSLLETIERMHARDPDDPDDETDRESLVRDFRAELHFLKTLINQSGFLGTLDFSPER